MLTIIFLQSISSGEAPLIFTPPAGRRSRVLRWGDDEVMLVMIACGEGDDSRVDHDRECGDGGERGDGGGECGNDGECGEGGE